MDQYPFMPPPSDQAAAAAKAAAAAAAAAAAHAQAAAAEAAGAVHGLSHPYQMMPHPQFQRHSGAYMQWPGGDPQQGQWAPRQQAPTGGLWNPYAGMMPPQHQPIVSAPPYTALAGLTIPARRPGSEREDASGRWVLEPEDVLLLERVFALEKCPGRELRSQLASRLHVKPRQIQVWFQNKRQRTKNGAKPTVAEALAHKVYSAEHRTQKEPAELLMNMASGGVGSLGGAGGEAGVTARGCAMMAPPALQSMAADAPELPVAEGDSASDAGSGSPAAARACAMTVPSQAAASDAAATAAALVAAASDCRSTATALAADQGSQGIYQPTTNGYHPHDGADNVTTGGVANGTPAAGPWDVNRLCGPCCQIPPPSCASIPFAIRPEAPRVDLSNSVSVVSKLPSGTGVQRAAKPESPAESEAASSLAEAANCTDRADPSQPPPAGAFAAAEAGAPSYPPLAPAGQQVQRRYSHGSYPLPHASPSGSIPVPASPAMCLPGGSASAGHAMVDPSSGATASGQGGSRYPDGFTDGHMLWVRSDILMLRPDLLSADAAPIFVPPGQRPPAGCGGVPLSALPGHPQGSAQANSDKTAVAIGSVPLPIHDPRPNHAPPQQVVQRQAMPCTASVSVPAVGGIPMVRSTTQEACANAMLALSGSAPSADEAGGWPQAAESDAAAAAPEASSPAGCEEVVTVEEAVKGA